MHPSALLRRMARRRASRAVPRPPAPRVRFQGGGPASANTSEATAADHRALRIASGLRRSGRIAPAGTAVPHLSEYAAVTLVRCREIRPAVPSILSSCRSRRYLRRTTARRSIGMTTLIPGRYATGGILSAGGTAQVLACIPERPEGPEFSCANRLCQKLCAPSMLSAIDAALR